MYQPLSQASMNPETASEYNAPVPPVSETSLVPENQTPLTAPLLSPPPIYEQRTPNLENAPAQYPGVQYAAVPLSDWSNYQVMSVVAAPPPNYSAPHDFLMLALVATILCAILNLISLAFGIPAVILSAMSMNARHKKDYPRAKDYGKYSLLLSTINISFTLLAAMLIIGLTIGLT